MIRVFSWLCTFVLGLALPALHSSTAHAADDALIFTSPPRETPEAGAQLYGPLAEHLSELLGRPVVYRHPGSWPVYARDMRADVYDIVFDGPHFVAWRMAHLGHKPLVKLPGDLAFHVIARADEEHTLAEIDGLIGMDACCIAPPNLATMSMLALFPNPARQPNLVAVKGGFEGVYKALQDGRCVAGSLRNKYYEGALTDEQRRGLRILATTPALPDQAISAGSRISAAERERIVASLSAGHASAMPLLKRFAPMAPRMERASEAEYEGHNLLLEGVVFGW